MNNYARGEADRFSFLIDADFGAIAGRLRARLDQLRAHRSERAEGTAGAPSDRGPMLESCRVHPGAS